MDMNSVSEQEFKELLEFENEVINSHMISWELDLNEIFSDRSQNFEKIVNESTLNKFEVLIISGYADHIAKYLNNELRSHHNYRQDCFMLYEYLLNKALAKLKSVANSTVYVCYEANEDKENNIQWFVNRINETVQFPNFLSSSIKKWRNCGLYLKIETCEVSSGKYIAPLTGKERMEDEVLFMSNTVFKVTQVDIENNTISLTELQRRYQGNYILYDLYYLNIKNKEVDEELL